MLSRQYHGRKQVIHQTHPSLNRRASQKRWSLGIEVYDDAFTLELDFTREADLYTHKEK